MNDSIDDSASSKQPKIRYTIFPDVWPKKKTYHVSLLSEFVERLSHAEIYPNKRSCPLISLSEYGDSIDDEHRCLRYGSNVTRVWGCELDYDGEELSIEDAADKLEEAGIASVLYTSPSYTTDKPRWRALFPFASACTPEKRRLYVGRANAVLGRVASRESFTLSQSFYMGRVRGARYYVMKTEGRLLDTITGLQPEYPENSHSDGSGRDMRTDAELKANIRSGHDRYQSMLSLSGRWAPRGMDAETIEANLIELLGENYINDDGVDFRKRARKIAESAVRKFGETRAKSNFAPTIRDSRKETTPPPEAERTRLPALPDGLTAHIVEWAAQRARNVCPQLDLAVGLTATALLTLNRYTVAEWNTPLQPYVMTLAPTGSGKSEARKSLSRFFHQLHRADGNGIDLTEHITAGSQSYHALFDKLAEEPHLLLWLWDEAARKWGAASRNPSSIDYQVMSHILDLYGHANEFMPGILGRQHAIPGIDRPFLLVLAFAQPLELLDTITNTTINTGVLPRFLLLDFGDGIPKANRETRDDGLPREIIAAARAFREVEDESVTVRFDRQVRGRLLEFDDLSRKRMALGPIEQTIWSRTFQNAVLFSGLLAVGQSPRAPKINAEVCDYAIALASRSAEDWIARLGSSATGGSWNEKLTKRIEEFIREPVKLISRTHSRRPTERKLLDSGLVPIGLLKRCVKYDKRRDVEEALETLVESETVERSTHHGSTVFRWKG